MRASGVTVTTEAKSDGLVRSAFIEGPEHMSIELIEDHSRQPAGIPD